MGIRFFCPNGHKLNVKEFQAGRRGICPFCGARIQIPTQSTRASSHSERPGDAANAETSLFHGAQESDSSPNILPGEPPSRPGDPMGGRIGPSVPLGGPSQGGPSMGGSALPNRVAAPPAAATGPASLPAGVVLGTPNALKAPAAMSASAAVASTRQGSITPSPVSQPLATTGKTVAPNSVGTNIAAPLNVPPPSPSTTEPPDPIAEAPEMIWYVRPASGGQFGPAPGELMRSWLVEGRVSADSLVWREGWHDWQEAASVFPKLRANQGIDFLKADPNVASVPSATGQAHRPKVHRPVDRSQWAWLALLSLAVVLLFFVFLWMLFHQ